MAVGSAEFEQWYRELHPQLGTSIALAFGDVALAQEATDEAFARALERWERVRFMASPSGWVYRVAFNDARRRQRRRRLEQRLMAGLRIAEGVEPPGGELWQVVSTLPERQREAVVLRHVGHLREAEIGEVMGISRGAVSSTLRAAYLSLRVALAESESERVTEAR